MIEKKKLGRPMGIAPHTWKTGPNPLHHAMHIAFNYARNNAKTQKTEWKISWEDFKQVWEPIWHLRGRSATDLCWTRIDLEKAWCMDNVEVMTRHQHGKNVRKMCQ